MILAGRLSLAALLLSAAAASACNDARAKKDHLPPSSSALPPPAVPVLESGDAGPVAADSSQGEAYRGTGSIQARQKAELGPKSTGVIAAITVAEGDRVKKGQLLFRVDSQQASLAVAQARAGLDSAKVSASIAELDYKRTKELFDRGSVAPATYDQAKSRYDATKSAVRQAEVAVSQAKKLAGDTAVYAPFDGVVSAKLKSVGEMATVTPPSIVLVVQDVDVVELRARMPERALRRLQQGDSIELTFPSTGEHRSVRITRINPTIDVRTRTVEVVAEFANRDGRLKPGMLAEVTFGAGDSASADGGAPKPASQAKSP